jgi:hypothetical protein
MPRLAGRGNPGRPECSEQQSASDYNDRFPERKGDAEGDEEDGQQAG